MELRPHDLLRIKDITRIDFDSKRGDWLQEALILAPFAVMRRAPQEEKRIPIGIRGGSREQRLAGVTDSNNIKQYITPEELTASKGWRDNKHLNEIGIAKNLELIDGILSKEGFLWGPTGSIGFELASGVTVVNKDSDLDIILRISQFISLPAARQLLDELLQVPVKMDILLETPEGAIALEEYAGNSSQMLLRTIYGPCLIKSPWI